MDKQTMERINRDNSDYKVNWQAVAQLLWEELCDVLESEFSRPAEPMNYWISAVRDEEDEG